MSSKMSANQKSFLLCAGYCYWTGQGQKTWEFGVGLGWMLRQCKTLITKERDDHTPDQPYCYVCHRACNRPKVQKVTAMAKKKITKRGTTVVNRNVYRDGVLKGKARGQPWSSLRNGIKQLCVYVSIFITKRKKTLDVRFSNERITR